MKRERKLIAEKGHSFSGDAGPVTHALKFSMKPCTTNDFHILRPGLGRPTTEAVQPDTLPAEGLRL